MSDDKKSSWKAVGQYAHSTAHYFTQPVVRDASLAVTWMPQSPFMMDWSWENSSTMALNEPGSLVAHVPLLRIVAIEHGM
mmetsp:Transcript_9127/g.14985  ORF Transcript_9127/g.14985 Transcript_9127/m.14985 type:complete len:80 (-) Transcript_9127:4612-4851(-)